MMLKDWDMNVIPFQVPANPPNHMKGILNIDGKKVKNLMSTTIQDAIDNLKNYLLDLAKTKADETNEELYEFNRKLSQAPTSLPDFVKYMEDKKEGEMRAKYL
jgi:hypothetical protein